ncbi:MAG TPA: ankyrin repeat domain-containing protein [Ideonella sp.]|nr:ankyrin repeat domain-containing protein [Ideonella sp.]
MSLPKLRTPALVGALLLSAFSSIAGVYEDFFLMVELDRPRELIKIVERGFDPNSLSTKGESGLYLALRGDSNEAAELLISLPKVDVNARNAAGESPLMMAALRKNLPAMRKLIERGALINQPGWTPLHYAATGGSLEAIELLLAKGADINALSPNGSTPLMLAAGYGGEDSAELLRKRGADITPRNQRELTAADFAKRAGRDALAKRLETAAAAAKP